MSNTQTYTFTREQLRQAFKKAAERRDHEIIREGCDHVWIMRVSSHGEFAEDAVKRLIDSVQPQDGSKEAEDKEEPKVEYQEAEPKGYISSRSVDKLQFNIDTLKLGNLPGAYNGIQEEGGFFKAFTTAWNNGDWEEGYGCLYGDDTVSNTLDGIHCYGNFWVNPKYANSKVSDLGDIGCRSVAVEGKTDICLAVYYLKKDGTVIAYDIDAD